MVQSYCLRCKNHTDMTDEHNAVAKNGRNFLKGKCSMCGSGMAKMSGGALNLAGQGTGGSLLLPGETQGGAVNPELVIQAMSVIGWLDTAIPEDVKGEIRSVVSGVVEDVLYIITNPMAERYKNIFVKRLPNLARRWDVLAGKIKFMERKKKPPKGKISKLLFMQDKITATTKMLILRAPVLKEYSEQRKAQLAAREEKRLNKLIDQVEVNINEIER